MLKTNLLLAFRGLRKDRGFTVINILGLALGIAVCLLIVFFVTDELRYDRYNTQADRIYRVNSETKFGGASLSLAICAPPVAGALATSFPEVADAVRLTAATSVRIKKGDIEIKEDRVLRADPGIFDVFTLPMIEGDPQTALQAPNSTVITESTAKKYFGRTDVVGKTLYFANEGKSYAIRGVIRDIPRQSHFQADIFIDMAGRELSESNNWTAINFNTYILLKPGADVRKLERQLPTFFAKKLNEIHFDVKAFEAGGNYYRLDLTPLTDIHLHSNRSRELGANGSIEYIYSFSAVALLVLIMAAVNFMNLSTARSAGRARDVGVRKVLGSSRGKLVFRFLLESILVTSFATLLAIGLAWALLPVFNRLSGKELKITAETLIPLIPITGLGILVIGTAAGAYPAFFLSGFRPKDVLKGKLAMGLKGGSFRSLLVVGQFAISIFLIISTGVIYRQLQYIRNKDLGFDRNQVMIIRNAGVPDNITALKQEMNRLPGVAECSVTTFPPTGKIRWPFSLSMGNTSVQLEHWVVDADYVPTMGMRMTTGRNFSKQLATDSSAIIINESAAALMGIAGDPLNKTVSAGDKTYHIIGVVKDFNFNSLRDNISPLSLVLGPVDGNSVLCIRVSTGDLTALVSRIESKWRQFVPHLQFDYSFMDDDFNSIYQAELRMGHVFTAFALLAIGIACLGLFGLAAYAAEQRRKEIGIRKVLGASVAGILGLLSKELVKWVILSFCIAAPLAGWAMHRWLQGFAYRAGISAWVVGLGGVSAVVIAFLTVGLQSFKAARANPVEALRSE
jgi:putative ABC transport system permease protein